jgi:hypothetical protein
MAPGFNLVTGKATTLIYPTPPVRRRAGWEGVDSLFPGLKAGAIHKKTTFKFMELILSLFLWGIEDAN